MGPRELVILLLGLALVAVVLRGLHVAMRARRGQIKLAIDKNIPRDINLETLEKAEFPNGGARVVARSLRQVNLQNQEADSHVSASGDLRLDSSSIPVLMDNVALSQREAMAGPVDESLADDLYNDNVEFESFHVDSNLDLSKQEKATVRIEENDQAIDDEGIVVIEGIEDLEGTASEEKGKASSIVEDSTTEFESSEQDSSATNDPAEIAAEFENFDAFDEDKHQDTELEAAALESVLAAEMEIVNEKAVPAVERELVEPSTTEAIIDAHPESDLATAELNDLADSVEVEYAEELEQESQPEPPDVYRHNLQLQDNPERREPEITFDDELVDQFSDFSMTAGERIGVDKPLADQVELFESAHGHDEPPADSGRKKKSFFANLAKKVIPDKETESYGASGEYEVFPEDVYEQGDLVDPLLEEAFDDELEEKFTAELKTELASSTQYKPAQADNSNDIAQQVDADQQLDETMEMLEETLSDLEQRELQDGRLSDTVLSTNSGLSIELADPEDLETIAVVEDETVTAMAPRPQPKPEPAPTINGPSEVVVLNVMSREGREFHGNDLLQVLITSGLKFGEMNIFHKRLDNSNHGPVLFSVANMINPGTFDLNTMEEFRTRGVTLFLSLPSAINNLEALDLMLETAQQIRGALDGELRDDSRNVMTAQTIEHYRQRVRDFELSLLKTANRH